MTNIIKTTAKFYCCHVALAVLTIYDWSAIRSQAQPANDMFANRKVITGTNITAAGSNTGATRETGEPFHAGVSGGASVWWSWRAPTQGIVTISTAGSSFDTVLGVYTGASVSSLTQVASNDDDPFWGAYSSWVTFQVVSNQTYQIAVDGYNAEAGTVQLLVALGSQGGTALGPPAPAWTLPDQNGAMVSSSKFTNKVVIVNFWATWCGPCRAEMPDFVGLQEKYRGDGLVFVGADTGESATVVQSFLASWTPAINYQIVIADSALMQAYGGISAIPTTFIIDRHNTIRRKFVGTQTRDTIESQIIPLLFGETRLGCQRNGNSLVFHWPTNAIGFTLESATNLSSPAWIAWPTTPTVVKGTNIVQTGMSTVPRAFRLRMNY